MGTIVLDKTGELMSFDWLRAKYGNVVFLDAGEQDKFELVQIRETEGPATLTVWVLDEDGTGKAWQPVANHWPDPELQDLRGGGLVSLWQPQACVALTDEMGQVGFGLGSGSYITNREQGGPHTVWVLSPSVASDGLSGIGMLGGTNHMGPLRLTFRLVRGQEEEEPEPEPEPEEKPGCLGLLQQEVNAPGAHAPFQRSSFRVPFLDALRHGICECPLERRAYPEKIGAQLPQFLDQPH